MNIDNFIPAQAVGVEHLPLLRRLQQHSSNWFDGFSRPVAVGLEEYWIDTKFDDELVAAGILDASA